MRKKSASIITILLLLIMADVSFRIMIAKADGTIYIRSDGSVSPSTAAIYTADNITYVMTATINNSIVIERNNVVFDGSGHTLQEIADSKPLTGGISLFEIDNVTIRNLQIRAFYWGIYLQSCSNIRINKCKLEACEDMGILFLYSDCVEIYENNITSNNIGIGLVSSTRSSIYNNIGSNIYGIQLEESSSIRVYANNVTANVLRGMWLSDVQFTILSKNNLVGNTIFLMGRTNYPSTTNNTICGNTLKVDEGITLYYTQNNTFHHNNFDGTPAQMNWFMSFDIWDHGHPEGGNYWDGYNGTDSYNGPFQNETGSDGIGDTPLLPDRYPLMKPYISVPGNVNYDRTVDSEDKALLSLFFGSGSTSLEWNPEADFNIDGMINILDAIILANNFGRTWS
jgi:parallel beta-helix repeat protein